MLPLLDALKTITERTIDYDFVINLSDADVALRTNAEILRFLRPYRGRNLVQIHTGDNEWLSKARNFTAAHTLVECGGYGEPRPRACTARPLRQRPPPSCTLFRAHHARHATPTRATRATRAHPRSCRLRGHQFERDGPGRRTPRVLLRPQRPYPVQQRARMPARVPPPPPLPPPPPPPRAAARRHRLRAPPPP